MSKENSERWFTRYHTTKNTSLCKTTTAPQYAPINTSVKIKRFHAILLRERRQGNFHVSDLANMNQILSPFVLDDCKTRVSAQFNYMTCDC